MTQNLKPCPFCGCVEIEMSHYHWASGDLHHVLLQCENRECLASVSGKKSEEAVNAWNKRQEGGAI